MKTECEKPTKKYPNGRSGTSAGISAHKKAKEKLCEACAEFKREYARRYREKNKDKQREADRLYREKNRDKKREADRRYREKHKVELKARKKEYYNKNTEALREVSRKWHHANKEKASAYSREYRKNNSERISAAKAKWREENIEHVKEEAAKWREQKRDFLRSYMKTYYRENSEKWEGFGRKRRALRASQPHEAYTREEVAELHGTVCYLCGGEVDMSLPWGNDRSPSMDHRWPLNVPGGPGDVLSNMWVTHAVCNVRKKDLMVEDLKLPFAEPEFREWSYATIDSELV